MASASDAQANPSARSSYVPTHSSISRTSQNYYANALRESRADSNKTVGRASVSTSVAFLGNRFGTGMPSTSPDADVKNSGLAKVGATSPTLTRLLTLYPHFRNELQALFDAKGECDIEAKSTGTVLERHLYMVNLFIRRIMVDPKGPLAMWLHKTAEKAGSRVNIYGVGIGEFLHEHEKLESALMENEQLTSMRRQLNQKWFGPEMEGAPAKIVLAGPILAMMGMFLNEAKDERWGFLAQPESLSNWKTPGGKKVPFGELHKEAKVLMPLHHKFKQKIDGLMWETHQDVLDENGVPTRSEHFKNLSFWAELRKILHGWIKSFIKDTTGGWPLATLDPDGIPNFAKGTTVLAAPEAFWYVDPEDGDLSVDADMWRSGDARADIRADVAQRRLQGHVRNEVAKNMAEVKQVVMSLKEDILSQSVSMNRAAVPHLFQPQDHPVDPGPSFGRKNNIPMASPRATNSDRSPREANTTFDVCAQKSFISVSKELLRVNKIDRAKPSVGDAVAEVMDVMAKSIALMAAETVHPAQLIKTVASVRGNQYSDSEQHRMFRIYQTLKGDEVVNMPSMLRNLVRAYFNSLPQSMTKFQTSILAALVRQIATWAIEDDATAGRLVYSSMMSDLAKAVVTSKGGGLGRVAREYEPKFVLLQLLSDGPVPLNERYFAMVSAVQQILSKVVPGTYCSEFLNKRMATDREEIEDWSELEKEKWLNPIHMITLLEKEYLRDKIVERLPFVNDKQIGEMARTQPARKQQANQRLSPEEYKAKMIKDHGGKPCRWGTKAKCEQAYKDKKRWYETCFRTHKEAES